MKDVKILGPGCARCRLSIGPSSRAFVGGLRVGVSSTSDQRLRGSCRAGAAAFGVARVDLRGAAELAGDEDGSRVQEALLGQAVQQGGQARVEIGATASKGRAPFTSRPTNTVAPSA